MLYCIFHCVFSYSVLRTFCYGRQHCISLAIHHKLRSAKTNWLSCETPLLVWYGWYYDRSTFRPHCRASKIGHLWQCYILPACLSLLNRHVNHPVSRHHPLSSAAFSQIRSHLTRQMRSELHVALQPPAIMCVRNLVLWGCSACVITCVQTLIPSTRHEHCKCETQHIKKLHRDCILDNMLDKKQYIMQYTHCMTH